MPRELQSATHHPLVEAFQPAKAASALKVDVFGMHHALDGRVPTESQVTFADVEDAHATGRNHRNGQVAVVYGDQGYIVLGNRRWRAYGPKHKLLKEGAGNNDGSSHIRNFLDCVKSRKDPYLPAETGHRLASLMHMGNISMRLDRKLQWNPDKEEFVGDKEANAMRSKPMRKPWSLEA